MRGAWDAKEGDDAELKVLAAKTPEKVQEHLEGEVDQGRVEIVTKNAGRRVAVA